MPQGVLGVVMPTMVGTFYRTVLDGIMQAARERELHVLVMQATAAQLAASRLAWQCVDGWIAVFEHDGVAEVQQYGLPVVTVSSIVAGVPPILPDNVGGMLMVTRHLIGLGHTRIAFVGSTTNSDVPERLVGYRMALEEAGLPFDEQLTFWTRNDTLPAGREIGRAILERGINWSACAAATDQNALGLLETLQSAGVRVPQDVVLTGFDDMPETQTSRPSLTTVRLRFDEMGRMAVVRLLEQITNPGRAPEPTIIPTALVVRESCGSTVHTTELVTQSSNAGTWQMQTAQRLAQAIAYPITVPPGTPADAVWPSVATPVRLLEAALSDQEEPDDARLYAAWAEATARTAYPDSLNTVIDLLEDAADQQLAAEPSPDAVLRVRAALRRLRTALLRLHTVRGSVQLNRIEGAVELLEQISRDLTASDMASLQTLGWLRHAPIAWACLGLWEGGYESRHLRMVGSLPELPAVPLCDAMQFPPLAVGAFGAEAPQQVILLELVESAQHRWGALALGMPFAALDELLTTPQLWASLLAARLDATALLDTLAKQRNATQVAYDRERALASTIRELGCPILPLDGRALLVPLIGMIDTVRAGQIIEDVTRAISRMGASDLLLDVTGVPLIDTHVAGALIQMAQMAQLLGARTMLIGVRPEIAQSLVGLGANLQQLTSVASLDAALRMLRRRHPAMR